ncbi:kinase-like protein [Exidia glandulosa HHB12029]|uniref:Kinase-like protein n=1 Tax=Exidia glandulosa HHB12029 TaxID=1314781 RepID=A0A165HE99_EXIGL|nr:kinase-like protein [Exidia glandulosa HHB12029]
MSPPARRYLRDVLKGIKATVGVIDAQAATAFAVGKDVAPGPFKAVVTALEILYTRCKGMKHHRKQSQQLFDFCRTIVCAIDANVQDGLSLDDKIPHIEKLHQLLVDTCQQLQVIDAYPPFKAFAEHENIKQSFVDLRVALTESFDIFGISTLLRLQKVSEDFAAAATEDLHQIIDSIQELGQKVDMLQSTMVQFQSLLQLAPPSTVFEATRRLQVRARVEPDGSASQRSSLVTLREMQIKAGGPPLPLVDLANEAQRLPTSTLISHGAKADMWQGCWLGDPSWPLALKYPRASSVEAPLKPAHVMRFHRQLTLLQRVNHRNVIRLLGVKYKSDESSDAEEGKATVEFIAFPWMQNGNILTYMAKHKQADGVKLMLDVARGLAHLHNQQPPIVHRAVQPSNILINDDGEAVVSDFDIAKALSEDDHGSTFTVSNGAQDAMRWMAPELSDGRSEQSADVYSWAMTALQVLSGLPPFFRIKQPGRVVIEVSQMKRPLPEDYPPDSFPDGIWPLFQQCWRHDPAERPTMGDVVEAICQMRPDLKFV